MNSAIGLQRQNHATLSLDIGVFTEAPLLPIARLCEPYERVDHNQDREGHDAEEDGETASEEGEDHAEPDVPGNMSTPVPHGNGLWSGCSSVQMASTGPR